jgi:GTP-binding protein HflX
LAKQSFDLPLLPSRDETGRDRAVILKAIQPDDPSESSAEIDAVGEIGALADTAGVDVVDAVIQRRQKLHPGTYVGKGKLEELKERAEAAEAKLVIVDDALTPRQGRNIEEATGLRVVDRTELIMDIFARNAKSHQAKLQVELAQLRYSSQRLKRMWTHLSRMEGGAVGTRGPGETQLETDRRIIRAKIDVLKERLEEIEQQRETQHKGRAEAFRVALVGYTNAGKSTLLRALTGADVLVEDRLFSTLDTSTRQWRLEGSREVLLSDTVGFIRKLPPGLVASFQATLMEAREADLLLHIVDASSPSMDFDIESVRETLAEVGCGEHRTILVFNKIDRVDDQHRIDLQHELAEHPHSIAISAAQGIGLVGPGSVSERVLEVLHEREAEVEYLVPHARSDLVNQLHRLAEVLEQGYENEGVRVRVRISPEERGRFEGMLAAAGLSPVEPGRAGARPPIA